MFVEHHRLQPSAILETSAQSAWPIMATLKFAPFSSEIELPFYSALFASKLDHDKLSDSARPVLGLYEPRIGVHPDDSVKMQVLANALTSTT